MNMESQQDRYSSQSSGDEYEYEADMEIDKNLLTVNTMISMDMNEKSEEDSSSSSEDDDEADRTSVRSKASSLEEAGGARKSTSKANQEGKKKLWKRIPCLGLLLILFKITLNGFGNLLIKKLDVEPAILVFFRSMVVLSVSIPWIMTVDQPIFPIKSTVKTKFMLVARGIISLMGTMAATFAAQNMPLGDLQMISGLQPIFVSMSARIFLKEACGLPEMSALVLMLGGVTLVIQPPFIFGSDGNIEQNSTFWIAAGFHLGATALTANVQVILRHFRGQSVASLTASREIIFIIVTFFIIMIANLDLSMPTLEVKLKILTLASFSLVSSVLNIMALKIEEANKIALVDRCSAIILAFLLDYFFFGDIPNYLQIIGVGLVIFSIVVIGVKKIILQRRKNQKKEDSQPKKGHFIKNILIVKKKKEEDTSEKKDVEAKDNIV